MIVWFALESVRNVQRKTHTRCMPHDPPEGVDVVDEVGAAMIWHLMRQEMQ